AGIAALVAGWLAEVGLGAVSAEMTFDGRLELPGQPRWDGRQLSTGYGVVRQQRRGEREGVQMLRNQSWLPVPLDPRANAVGGLGTASAAHQSPDQGDLRSGCWAGGAGNPYSSLRLGYTPHGGQRFQVRLAQAVVLRGKDQPLFRRLHGPRKLRLLQGQAG